jgi:uncharacterized DUF497 family protein
MEFEWDEAKRQANLEKHGLDFRDALEFKWESAYVVVDDRFDYREERRIALGTFRGRLHVVVHTNRGNITRLISFRKANAREESIYVEEKGPRPRRQRHPRSRQP